MPGLDPGTRLFKKLDGLSGQSLAAVSSAARPATTIEVRFHDEVG
jgi:hypothetical protein